MRAEFRKGPGLAHEMSIAARVAARAIGRRLRGNRTAEGDDDAFRAGLSAWIASLPAGALAERRFQHMPATQPPWVDTELDVETGDSITLLSQGRVYLSRLLDVWVPPWFQLWYRVGEKGPIFRGTRDTHTFVASGSGRLWVANYFPGEWSDEHGGLGTPVAGYAKVSGGMSVAALRWARGTDVAAVVRESLRATRAPKLVVAEAQRLAEPAQAPPEHWDYLWYLGPAEVYRPCVTTEGRAAIHCRTHGDTGILHRDARMPLTDGTRLRWSWRVDELPTDLPEDTLPSHEYLSIAVEFDDGQDITYFWSTSLPVGMTFGCPLPNWKERETHVVVRSGAEGLGRWFDEERDVHADYARIVGGPAREVVRVWLIANSLLTRGQGRCEYAGIELVSGEKKIEVL
jgi:hypothetical protein